MSNEETVGLMMKSAGYESVEFKRIDCPVLIGNSVSDAIAFQLAIGPAGEVFREAGVEAEEKRSMIEAALGKAIEQQNTSEGGIIMPSSSWMITGTNPG
jgi:hypothetical protein